jgi:hypothetical protein
MSIDFSGDYVLDRSASSLAGGSAAIESATVRIDHREPVFRYQAAFVGAGRTFEYSFELSTDGREVSLAPNDVSRLSWKGNALVSEHRTETPERTITMSWHYELLDDGHRLRATERMRGGGQDQDNVWEFERR